MISFIGNGLNIAISAEYKQEWMAFSSWYSLRRSLPDAEISLLLPKIADPNLSHFRWLNNNGIKRYKYPQITEDRQLAAAHFLLTNNFPQPIMLIDSSIMALRELPPLSCQFGVSELVWLLNGITAESLHLVTKNEIPLEAVEGYTKLDLCAPCTSNDPSTFVGINKCGRFDKDIWTQAPFSYTKQLRTPELSLNELIVLDMWAKMEKPYVFMA